MPLNAIYLGVFWLFYYAIHSALAAEKTKLFFAQRMPQVYHWYRFLYSLFAGINFALLAWFHSIAPSRMLYNGSIAVQTVGVVFGLIALVVFVLALRQYDWQFWISNRGENETKLRTTGLNNLVRHPLYFAVLLALISLVLVFPNWKNLVFTIITTLYIFIGALLEERKLINKYGRDYLEYRKRVKMLIPFIL